MRRRHLLLLIAICSLNQLVLADESDEHVDVFQREGQVLAQGSNATPTGRWNVKTYRLEKVQLPDTMPVWVQGERIETDEVYRLTVTGGPFPVGATPAVLWVDDQPNVHVQEGRDLTELTTLLTTPSAVRNGSRLAVSYGVDEPKTELPERFQSAP